MKKSELRQIIREEIQRLYENTITFKWDEWNNTLKFSDGEKVKIDYDGDFKYKGKWFNIIDAGGPIQLEKELEKNIKGVKFKSLD